MHPSMHLCSHTSHNITYGSSKNKKLTTPPGAGGKGGPTRTKQIDEIAAKHFITTSLQTPRITKFLLISHLGSRRTQPRWMDPEDWKFVTHINDDVLPAYYKAKLEADEYLTALSRKVRESRPDFQAICLRPGLLSDALPTGLVQLGRTRKGKGSVTREDVGRVADSLLARADTRGWYDLLNGLDEGIEEAVDRVVREGDDAVEGEDVDGMVKRFGL